MGFIILDPIKISNFPILLLIGHFLIHQNPKLLIKILTNPMKILSKGQISHFRSNSQISPGVATLQDGEDLRDLVWSREASCVVRQRL